MSDEIALLIGRLKRRRDEAAEIYISRAELDLIETTLRADLAAAKKVDEKPGLFEKPGDKNYKALRDSASRESDALLRAETAEGEALKAIQKRDEMFLKLEPMQNDCFALGEEIKNLRHDLERLTAREGEHLARIAELEAVLQTAHGGLKCAAQRFVLDRIGPSAAVVVNAEIATKRALANQGHDT